MNNNYGLSVKDAECICLKLMEERFVSHSEEAYRIAKGRFEEFVFNYLKTLTERAPHAIGNLSDPGIQSAILEAEEGFAKTGDIDLGQILVEMLVKRTSETRRDVRQLALNEAIAAAQKLATKHIDALSLLFFVRRVQVNSSSLQDFIERATGLLAPLCESFAHFSVSDAQYLEATGCAVRVGTISWAAAMRERYPGFFYRGVIREETPAVAQILDRATAREDLLFQPSWHDPNVIRVNAVTKDQARELAESSGLDREDLANLMSSYPLSDEQIAEMFTAVTPALGSVLELWSTVGFDSLEVSLTGIAVGHANFKKTVGDLFNAEIDVWIN
ncbi:LPO_1073/Vpar_1526 family protein [Streptosporangium nondiastaticum]|uniref:LPO_1073/Vpar_1526 family protein n=1 Tax=Streptosporangium nondiastaticum TaxID=35764 RepID=UPI0011B1FAC6|nr:LPO_1073/Vpar_1526 family protein [Streptosporangium nondiastaticum]